MSHKVNVKYSHNVDMMTKMFTQWSTLAEGDCEFEPLVTPLFKAAISD